MTTPDASLPDVSAAGDSDSGATATAMASASSGLDGEARVQRTAPDRDGPIRSAAFASPAGPAATAIPDPDPVGEGDQTVTTAVAHAVRLGYQVIGDNIRQGREAAKAFRQGEYNVRDVPHDLNILTMRLVNLARDLSATSFDIVERLLQNPVVPGAAPKAPGAGPAVAPPFTPASVAPAAAPAAGPAVMCRFSGAKTAVLQAATLDRPPTPVAPESLSIPALSSLDPKAQPVTAISFAAEGDALVVTIALPDDQPPGVYSGIVWAGDTATPLGALTIEVFG